MKLLILVLLLPLLVLSSCKLADDNPLEPEPDKRYIFLHEYGSSIDSFFYKEWSDNSWDKFNRIITHNGNMYATILNSDGTEYYYSASGFAGFQPSGESLILFDTPMTSMPDSIVFKQTYTNETTFTADGVSYTLKYERSLTDTVTVSVSFGVFNSCLWFASKSTLSASGQSDVQNSQFWLAKGPSDIKQTLNSGVTLTMTKGVVNGHGWGMTFPKIYSVGTENNISRLLCKLEYALFKNLNLKLE